MKILIFVSAAVFLTACGHTLQQNSTYTETQMIAKMKASSKNCKIIITEYGTSLAATPEAADLATKYAYQQADKYRCDKKIITTIFENYSNQASR